MTSIPPLQLEALEARLRVYRRDLLASIHSHLGVTDEAPELALINHFAERGSGTGAGLPENIDVDQLGYELAELRDIDAALERINTGHYGACAYCRAPIALERLRAHPTARNCLQCQSDVESRRRPGTSCWAR